MAGVAWVGDGDEEPTRVKGTGHCSPSGTVPPTDPLDTPFKEQEEGHQVLHKTGLETHLLELKVASFSEQYPRVILPSCINGG